MKAVLEIACFSIPSLLIARDAGADRIEFCRDYSAGGLSPSQEDILLARSLLDIPLHVIIRPHANGFTYNENEFTRMLDEIQFCKHAGVDGVVFGTLTSEKEIDRKQTEKLIHAAGPMTCCFHRAIDACDRPLDAIQHLKDCGIRYVLSSGTKGTALEGLDTLRAMNDLGGKELQVMPGGGIRSSTLPQFLNLGFSAFHSAAITMQNGEADASEIKNLKDVLNP